MQQKKTRTPIAKLLTNKGVLYQGDCLALLKAMKDKSVDCIFADPPFNLGKDYGLAKFPDQMPDQQYINWTHLWLSECVRVLKPGGSLFVYHIPRWLVKISSYLDGLDELEFRHWIAIKMKNGFPIRGRLHPSHYGLLYYTKRGKKRKFHVVRTPSPVCRHCGGLIRDYGGYRKKYPVNHEHVPLIQLADVWDDISPNIHNKSRPKSINELPSEVPERAILMSTNKGDVVFDPFVGGGGTLTLAELNGRYWVGSELGSVKFAARRLLNEKNIEKQQEAPNKIAKIFKTSNL